MTILVGLPVTAVKASSHRVERAIVNAGFVQPQVHVVINRAPADLPKQASSFDLPVAFGVLAGSGQLSIEPLEEDGIVGELALEGIARPIKGVLSIAMEAAKNANLRGLVVPRKNASEAAVVEGLEVIAVDSLAQTVAFYAGELDLFPTPGRIDELFERFSSHDIEFGDVRGQESAKRAMTLAAEWDATTFKGTRHRAAKRVGLYHRQHFAAMLRRFALSNVLTLHQVLGSNTLLCSPGKPDCVTFVIRLSSPGLHQEDSFISRSEILPQR